jgi:hypothetical protein
MLAADQKGTAPGVDDAARFLTESESTGPMERDEELSESMVRKTRDSGGVVVFEYYEGSAGLLHRSIVTKN